MFHLLDPSVSIVSERLHITMAIGQTGQRLRFILEENPDIAPRHTYVQYLDSHGLSREASQPPNPNPLLTRGSVSIQDSLDESWADVGWARIAVIEQGERPLFDGFFTIGSTQYEIQFERKEPKRMVAHQMEQAISPIPCSTCASQPNVSLNRKRQGWNAWDDGDWAEIIGSDDGCPSSRQIAYIGVAADCNYTASFDSTDDARRHILNVVNTASVVFENSFNVSISIRNMTISDPECPESVSETTQWNVPCSDGDLDWRFQTLDRKSVV